MISELPLDIQLKILNNLSMYDLKQIRQADKSLNNTCKLVNSEFQIMFMDFMKYWKQNSGYQLKCSKSSIYSAIIADQSKMGFQKNQLTYEQQEIINHKVKNRGEIIVVQAYAGTGKTTTLKNCCRFWDSNLRVLCIAFNRSAINHLRNMLSEYKNVTVNGFHKMAYNYFKGKNSDIEVIDKLKKEESEKFNDFCYSSKEKHDDEKTMELFERMKEKTVPYTHDGYLKHFQLLKLDLGYDVIFVDEAQDCNDCMASIILNQKNSTRIFFGDIHQNINTFRNKNNDNIIKKLFIEKTENVMKKYLSVSFRYGGKFGMVINEFLKTHLNCKKLLYTIGNNKTTIEMYKTYEELPNNTCIICRLNETVYKMMFYVSKNAITYKILRNKPIDFREEIEIHKDILKLMHESNPVCIHPKLKQFADIYEAIIYFRKNNKYKWLVRINIAEQHPQDCWEMARKHYNNENPSCIITNTHQCKGMEFDNIALSYDFCFGTEELRNVFYTAVTRVKKNIFIMPHLYRKEFTKPNIFDSI